MADSNTLDKAEALQEEHPAKETAEKQVDIRKQPDMKELEQLIAEEEGIETPPEVKADTSKGQEIPERYKGKTAEDLIAQLEEKEKYIQSRSAEIGEMKKRIAETEEVKKKIADIENGTLINEQYANKIPPKPVKPTLTSDEFYNDPVLAMQRQEKYLEDLQAWNEQYLRVLSMPILDMSVKTGKEKLYTELEKKYEKAPVKFDRKKIQEFLDKNPAYFKLHGTKAYEYAYHDTSATEFSSEKLIEDIRVEERRKLLEEMNKQRQAGNIGLSDLVTQPINSGSSPAYDEDRMEDDAEYREKVLEDIRKRNKR
jgi:hypothetical protein